MSNHAFEDGDNTMNIETDALTPDEVETWMTAPPDEALTLQRPLPDGSPRIVVRGVKEDPAGLTT
jgi:putative SOS response-associated peptidase YedK